MSAAYCAGVDAARNRFCASFSAAPTPSSGAASQPAQPPAGHSVILGKAVDDPDPFRDRQRGLNWCAVHQPMVDLVHDHHPAARLDRGDEGRQFLGGNDRAGGIGRRG